MINHQALPKDLKVWYTRDLPELTLSLMHDNQPLLDLISKILDEMQAINPVVLDVTQQTSITDHMIIASGRSSRHVKAVAQEVMKAVKQAGFPLLNSTGLDTGEWALIDCGDAIVHVMQPDVRDFYNLEGLWQA